MTKLQASIFFLITAHLMNHNQYQVALILAEQIWKESPFNVNFLPSAHYSFFLPYMRIIFSLLPYFSL